MKKIILKHANILNGKENMSVIEDTDILIEGNKIVKICKDIKDKGKVIDCTNKYVIPGLINLHVHVCANGKPSKSKVAEKTKLVKTLKSNKLLREVGIFMCKSYAKKALLSGVTTIRTVGGVGDFDSVLRDRINKGKVIGPRIVCCNEAIGVTGGHMDGTVAVAASSIDEAVAMVEERVKQGVDWIKIMITGGVLDCHEVGHPGELKMSEEMVKAICDKSHQLGLKVCAHVEGPEGCEIAINCGVDSIEHGSMFTDEQLDKFGSRGGVLVQTISPAVPFCYLDPNETGYGEVAKINTEVLLNGMVSSVKRCPNHNVLVGMGTDVGCPYCSNSNFYLELLYTNKIIKEISKEELLHRATEVNAKILGLDDKIGTIEEGKIADIDVFEKNPFDDFSNLKKPLYVISNGKIYKGKVKENKDLEEGVGKIITSLESKLA